MSFDVSKVTAVICGVEQAAKAIVRLTIPAIGIMLALEVVFGVNVGLLSRITTLLKMEVKDIVVYSIGLWVLYKAVVK